MHSRIENIEKGDSRSSVFLDGVFLDSLLVVSRIELVGVCSLWRL